MKIYMDKTSVTTSAQIQYTLTGVYINRYVMEVDVVFISPQTQLQLEVNVVNVWDAHNSSGL